MTHDAPEVKAVVTLNSSDLGVGTLNVKNARLKTERSSGSGGATPQLDRSRPICRWIERRLGGCTPVWHGIECVGASRGEDESCEYP